MTSAYRGTCIDCGGETSRNWVSRCNPCFNTWQKTDEGRAWRAQGQKEARERLAAEAEDAPAYEYIDTCPRCGSALRRVPYVPDEGYCIAHGTQFLGVPLGAATPRGRGTPVRRTVGHPRGAVAGSGAPS